MNWIRIPRELWSRIQDLELELAVEQETSRQLSELVAKLMEEKRPPRANPAPALREYPFVVRVGWYTAGELMTSTHYVRGATTFDAEAEAVAQARADQGNALFLPYIISVSLDEAGAE